MTADRGASLENAALALLVKRRGTAIAASTERASGAFYWRECPVSLASARAQCRRCAQGGIWVFAQRQIVNRWRVETENPREMLLALRRRSIRATR